jgi:hypothetical protein
MGVHHIMQKRIIHQEEKKLFYIYMPPILEHPVKEEINPNTLIIIGRFNIPILEMDRSSTKSQQRNSRVTLHPMNLIYVYKPSTQQLQNKHSHQNI